MKYSNVLYCSMVISISNLDAQQNAQQQKAAQESFNLLKRLPVPILEELGFKTRQMINQSSLGNPLQAYIVWLGSLKTFTEGDKPGEILQDVKELNYPVYACEMPVSSITIRKRNGKWTFGYYSEGKLFLIPTHGHPDLKFELYKPVPAENIFIELKRFVEKYENLLTLSSASPLFTVGKEELQPGESTWLKITIKGLYRFKQLGLAFPFLLRNKTPGIVNMEGGNLQHHIIRPEDIDPDGIYTMTRILTGMVPGKFNIGIEFY
jgi:hypothetical protein